ncbi:MAG: FecR domain-containing protein [Deltaproteobacteria bacterium]|nr:FecR domain-containing protein [Deltaproteobacteria bacterium]
MKVCVSRFVCVGISAFLCLLFPFASVSHARDSAKGLPEELRQLQIGEQFVRSDTSEVGTLTSIKGQGRMVVLHKRLNAGFYGKEKDSVFEEDALFSLKDCRARIEFKDKSVVMLAPESRLDVGEVALSLLEGKKSASFDMMKGKAIFYALPLFGYKDMKFQIKTLTAMVGVRGTKFGVEVQEAREISSGGGPVRVAGLGPMLAQVGQAVANVITRVYVFEGMIELTSLIDGKKQLVRENEILEADRRGLGEVRFDPAKTKSFLEEVAGQLERETLPGKSPQIMEQRYRTYEMERSDKLEDIKQREIVPPVSPSHPSGHSR